MAASTMWLTLQGNLTISNVTMCVPWVMLAFERLLRQPDVTAGLWLALAMSYLVLAGYPHVVQGIAVFLFLSLLPGAFGWARRGELACGSAPCSRLALVAVVFTLGLCAAQLLPMFELASESYRAAGVDYVRFAPQTFLRGLLFADIVPEELTPNFTLLGSMAVSMLFLSGALAARGARALGMLLATLFLCYLGFGAQAPGFEFIHRHGLVPGMRFLPPDDPVFLYRHRRRVRGRGARRRSLGRRESERAASPRADRLQRGAGAGRRGGAAHGAGALVALREPRAVRTVRRGGDCDRPRGAAAGGAAGRTGCRSLCAARGRDLLRAGRSDGAPRCAAAHLLRAGRLHSHDGGPVDQHGRRELCARALARGAAAACRARSPPSRR